MTIVNVRISIFKTDHNIISVRMLPRELDSFMRYDLAATSEGPRESIIPVSMLRSGDTMSRYILRYSRFPAHSSKIEKKLLPVLLPNRLFLICSSRRVLVSPLRYLSFFSLI